MSIQSRCCQKEKGVVKWGHAGVVTFNGTPGVPGPSVKETTCRER
ncbi:MAG: hypothetical protein JWP63_4669 [Candidatus Solibacter sp.]|nr:hypothetical protein [Candidatus Solibacter sp.]